MKLQPGKINISEFTGGLITVDEALNVEEEDENEGEIISTILSRKLSDFNQN